VNAADNIGVTRVDLRVNGLTVGNSTAAPWQFSWNSLTVADGAVLLTAVAYDAAGNSTVSSAAAITVSNATGSNTALSLSITSPADGSIVFGNTTIATLAADSDTSASVTQRLYIDGALAATVTGSSLNYRWNANRARSGVHTIMVTATDAAANSTTRTVLVKRK
jgi:hypothetical protein